MSCDQCGKPALASYSVGDLAGCSKSCQISLARVFYGAERTTSKNLREALLSAIERVTFPPISAGEKVALINAMYDDVKSYLADRFCTQMLLNSDCEAASEIKKLWRRIIGA